MCLALFVAAHPELSTGSENSQSTTTMIWVDLLGFYTADDDDDDDNDVISVVPATIIRQPVVFVAGVSN